LADHCQPKHHDCDPWTEKLLVMISGEGGWGKAEHPQLPKTAPATTGSNLVPIDRSNRTLLNGNLHASLFCQLVYDTLIPNTNNQSSHDSRTLERTQSIQYIWDRKQNCTCTPLGKVKVTTTSVEKWIWAKPLARFQGLHFHSLLNASPQWLWTILC